MGFDKWSRLIWGLLWIASMAYSDGPYQREAEAVWASCLMVLVVDILFSGIANADDEG